MTFLGHVIDKKGSDPSKNSEYDGTDQHVRTPKLYGHEVSQNLAELTQPKQVKQAL